MAPTTILFDFDYTLADSSEAIIDCFNIGLAGLGLPAAQPDAIRATIGLNLEDSLAAVAGESLRPRAIEFRRLWRERSDVIMVQLTRLLPGAAETIAGLSDQGSQLGVVSTKYRCRIEEVFERAGLRSRFGAIIGGDDVQSHKPHPEGLLLALERLRVRPAEALYVGDNAVDAEAAQRAGVPFVGVLSGVTSAERLRQWDCVAVVETVADLPRVLSTAAAGAIPG